MKKIGLLSAALAAAVLAIGCDSPPPATQEPEPDAPPATVASHNVKPGAKKKKEPGVRAPTRPTRPTSML